LEVMASMSESSVDSIVTDPPYGLSFMGKDWDHGVPGEAFWREALRVAKPGAHLLAFGGTRTHHRLMCAIEDAGWEIRDCLGWLYGSGFPKSLDVSKAIEREVVGRGIGAHSKDPDSFGNGHNPEYNITAPATPEAVRWNGWGTALKPAWEPIVLARKPIIGTVAQNVLEYGTGALNIDGCRVETADNLVTHHQGGTGNRENWRTGNKEGVCYSTGSTNGRFPANLLHDGSEDVLAVFPESKGQQGDVRGTEKSRTGGEGTVCYGEYGARPFTPKRGDGGSASRFFYCAKASSSERGEGNSHPTVKPLALMQYLCRLVTPPGGVVLDPFTGSGSTLLAALKEGFCFIGIEKEPKYWTIANERIAEATPSLFKEVGV
jgi:site-specific DNA-methyltransferase (adenine-specific)